MLMAEHGKLQLEVDRSYKADEKVYPLTMRLVQERISLMSTNFPSQIVIRVRCAVGFNWEFFETPKGRPLHSFNYIDSIDLADKA